MYLRPPEYSAQMGIMGNFSDDWEAYRSVAGGSDLIIPVYNLKSYAMMVL